MKRVIRVNALGVRKEKLYLAHELGGWTLKDYGDYLNNPLVYQDGEFIFEINDDAPLLAKGEEFKIVIPDMSYWKARLAWMKRRYHKVHVNARFDYDKEQRSFWILASNIRVVRSEEWDQNNVFL